MSRPKKVAKRVKASNFDTSEAQESLPTSRGPRWTKEEESELVNAVIPVYHLLYGNFDGGSVSMNTKTSAWNKIAARVSTNKSVVYSLQS